MDDASQIVSSITCPEESETIGSAGNSVVDTTEEENGGLLTAKQEKEDIQLRMQIYTSVLCFTFSPCGRYLAAGNNYGTVAIFSLAGCLSIDATKHSWTPIYQIQVAVQMGIYAIVSTKQDLVCGVRGFIRAWSWSDLIKKADKPAWSFILPTKDFSICEINSMFIDTKFGSNLLYCGCGDNNIYIFDLDAHKFKNTLKGHMAFVHCITPFNTRQEIASASEDGSVRVWDIRVKKGAIHKIEPYKNEMCERLEYGKWLGCVTMDTADDWLVCGGGPKLSMWHMRSLSATVTFDTPESCQNNAYIYQDTLFSAGTESSVFHWGLNGELKAKVPCTPNNVYQVEVNTNSDMNRVLCIAGSSPKIDVCTNFRYKAFSLTFSGSS